MSVWFFDDSRRNIADFRKHHPEVVSVLVEPDPARCPANLEDHCDRVLRQHGGNRFAKAVLSKKDHGAHYEVGGGVDPAYVEHVLKGVRPSAVLFDWDLTLSTCNGLELGHLMPPVMVRDAAVFYAGGTERFDALSATLRRLRASGARVFILTDNGAAKNSLDRREFLRLLKCFDPAFCDRDLVYGCLDKARVFAESILPTLPKRRNPLRRDRTTTENPWTARPDWKTAAKKRTAVASKNLNVKTRRSASY